MADASSPCPLFNTDCSGSGVDARKKGYVVCSKFATSDVTMRVFC